LVIAASVWDTPGRPREFDAWREFDDVLGSPPVASDRLPVGDSKAIYTAGGSLERLETSVLAFLRLCGLNPGGFRELCNALSPAQELSLGPAPWFSAADVPIPITAKLSTINGFAERWAERCDECGMGRPKVAARILTAATYNTALDVDQNKALLLSRNSLGLLAELVDPHGGQSTFVICDKHGGRNRYDGLLSEAFGDQLVLRREEGAERSSYRLGSMDVSFQVKAERHFPVAVASMVAKYTREVGMEAFNGYWRDVCPGVKPTRGYPVDARRFRDDVGGRLDEFGIEESVFWRRK
jgi:hypothetical protein